MHPIRYAGPVFTRFVRVLCCTVLLMLLGAVASTLRAEPRASAARVLRAPPTPPPASIASPHPDWGEPPAAADDLPQVLPDLPAAAGWARDLSAHPGETWTLLCAGHGLVVALAADTLVALRLSDGAQLWTYRLDSVDDLPLAGPAYLSSTALYLQLGGAQPAAGAFDSATGYPLWRSAERELVGAGEAGAWVRQPLQRMAQGKQLPQQGRGLWLLDRTTGAVVQDFRLGPVYGYAGQLAPEGSMYAVATPAELVCCHSDGTFQRLPRARQGWVAQLYADAAGVLAVEYPPDELDAIDDEGGARGYSGAYLHAIADPQTGLTEGDVVVSYYTLPAGALAWRRQWFDHTVRYSDSGLSLIRLTPQGAVFSGPRGVRVLRRGDGSALFENWRDAVNGPEQPKLGAVLPGAAVGRGLRPAGLADYAPRLLLLPGLTPAAWQPQLEPAALPLAADGHLLYLAQRNSQWAADEPLACLALVCLRVDAAYAPQPGELSLLDRPAQLNALTDSFYASPDPQQDAALMRSVIAQGRRGLNRLLELARLDDPVHLAAAAAAADYLCAQQRAPGYRAATARLLLHHLRRLGPDVAAPVIRWLDAPEYAQLRPWLTGVLAELGGPLAMQALRAAAEQRQQEQLPPPGAPVVADRPAPLLRDYYGAGGAVLGQYDLNQWAVAHPWRGTRYVAFTHAGLGGDRQIYLGIGASGVPAFDELLPTGLSDAVLAYNGRGGDQLAAPQGPLTLELDLPRLRLGHHTATAVLDGELGQWLLRATTQQVDTLRLDALRRDSDGDGLTDIAERLLLTDPARTDSDGDGVRDAVDPTPNVNAAAMGPLERSVARALDYFYATAAPSERTPEPAPFRYGALYFSVAGCGPVAFHRPGQYGVCLSSPALAQAQAQTLRGQADFTTAHVSVPAPGDGGVLELKLDFANGGYVVKLRELDGEYFPVQVREAWLS